MRCVKFSSSSIFGGMYEACFALCFVLLVNASNTALRQVGPEFDVHVEAWTGPDHAVTPPTLEREVSGGLCTTTLSVPLVFILTRFHYFPKAKGLYYLVNINIQTVLRFRDRVVVVPHLVPV